MHENNFKTQQKSEVCHNSSQESKNESAKSTQTHHSPAGLDDLGVGKSSTSIPNQVAHTVHAVVGERQGHGSLQGNLGDNRESGESGGGGGRAQIPTEHGRGEVGRGIEVETSGQRNTGDTVDTTADPCDLGTVDAKVGRDRAVETLLGEELGRVGGVGGGSSVSA